MQYVRGHKHDFDLWTEYGNPGWDFETVLKYFKKTENNLNIAYVNYKNGTYHSDKGPLNVASFGTKKPFEDVYLQALQEIGINTIADVNADIVLGAGENQINIWNGRRQSVATAFLIPAKHRKNLHIIYNAEVTRIIIDANNRAIGVKFTYEGKHKMKAFVTKEVILSAGSIMSPKVLMLSGTQLRI